MSDKEILDKYVDLDKSFLTDSEKNLVKDMLYKYKDASSLRDEIGICPNIEVEIDVTDKSPFFIRPYHVKEEYQNILDKEMKRLCYLGIIKEVFSLFMENSKRYCGILPYFGSTSYLYQRLPMGLNISPSICQSYMNRILDCLQSRKYYEAITDDLLLCMPTKRSSHS